ncbi:MAG TPA: PKD domain-containing protein [Puia sp.]|nr:PKD domain-containing protein [Puia sp.]
MNKKSSSTFRVDEQVYITMAILCVVALVTLAFRYATSHPCSPINMQINANAFIEGNVITFKAETQGGKSFAWNFGDNTGVEEHDATSTHVYKNAGKYTVTVIVNGECTEVQNVVITEAPVVSNNSLLPMFIGPDTAYVNQPVGYEDISINSTSWEWHFEDANTIDANTRKAAHTYTTAGPKKILLKVNGKADLVTGRLIYVIDRDAQKNAAREAVRHEKPVKPSGTTLVLKDNSTVPPLTNSTVVEDKKPEEKPKAPTATDAQLENMIRDVIAGNKTASDFSPFLCNNLMMAVTYNNDKTTFSAMCEALKEYKKKKLKKVTVSTVKDATNCILYMHVTIEKKGFLGL